MGMNPFGLSNLTCVYKLASEHSRKLSANDILGRRKSSCCEGISESVLSFYTPERVGDVRDHPTSLVLGNGFSTWS